MTIRTLNDIYRCPHCRAVAARGDAHCRGCGRRFSADDVAMMRQNVRSPVGAVPWNTRDIYRCVHCDKFIALTDKYCRGCGDEIENHERQLMRIKLSELAQQNTPSLLGLAIFVLLVILVSIDLVK